MGGQHGIRGYLLQAIVTVIESLSSKSNWKSVTIEPSDESEKVDVLWELSDNTKKVVQIKSSQNTITFNSAKKWINDLVSNAQADKYELICIGHIDSKLNSVNELDKVSITKKPLDINLLLSDATVKLDQFYEAQNKSKLSSTIKEVLLGSLNNKFSEGSIFGKTITSSDFDNTLLAWLTAIENHIIKNPFVKFLDIDSNDSSPTIVQKISTNFLNLIGWVNYSVNEQLEYFDEKTLSNEIANVDYYLVQESKLKDDTIDHILINTIYDFEYPENGRSEIRKYLTATNIITEELKNNRRIDPSKQNSIYNILIWLSTNESDLREDYVYKNREYFRNELFQQEQQYYFVDNLRASFIVSSIATAKNYRSDLPVKFLYPITEFNLSYNKIGKRGLQLPPEYINTTILPIIKEDKDKISVLLFCADPYDKENLKKVIWLLIRLTSGMANEYIVYFSDYEDSLRNEVIDVVNSFDNIDLIGKVTVKKSIKVFAKDLTDLTITPETNAGVQNSSSENSTEIRINPIFREQLPYGDIIKPILNTDRISSLDLKIFLSMRGIFSKNADKKRLIDIVVSLLFSPSELLNFINLINVKEKPVSSTPTILTLTSDSTVKSLFESIRPNFSGITDDLQAKLNDPIEFKEDPKVPDTFIYSSYVEKKDLTKHIALNTTWEPIKISYQKIDGTVIVNNVETNSRDGKVIANRIINEIKRELISKNYIQENVVQLSFSDFSSNKERVHFLLSFTGIDQSRILLDRDIRGLKFIFDESKEIPDGYKDKTEKDLISLFRGKNLAGLREISEDLFKDIILLEEISINYKYEINGVRGFYNVRYNFGDALKFKPIQGNFRSQSYLFSNRFVRQVRKINELEKMLNQEIEKLKVEKLRKFGKI